MENGIRIRKLLLRIDLLIIGVYPDPWRSLRKASLMGILPLHRCSGIVTSSQHQALHHIFRCINTCFCVFMEILNALDITVILKVCKISIGHSKLFSLINIRSSLHHMKAGCQHLGWSFPVCRIIISKSGNTSWLVMISQKQTVPCFPGKLFLPFDHNLFKFLEIVFLGSPFTMVWSLILYMLKLKHHVQLISVLTCIFLCLFDSHTGGFSNCHHIVSG